MILWLHIWWARLCFLIYLLFHPVQLDAAQFWYEAEEEEVGPVACHARPSPPPTPPGSEMPGGFGYAILLSRDGVEVSRRFLQTLPDAIYRGHGRGPSSCYRYIGQNEHDLAVYREA
jgi:hypothetical protein